MVLGALFSASADAEKELSAGRNRKEEQCVLRSSGRFDSAVFPSVSFPHDVLRCAIPLVWRIADTRHGCGGVPDESEWLNSAVLRLPGYPTLASLPWYPFRTMGITRRFGGFGEQDIAGGQRVISRSWRTISGPHQSRYPARVGCTGSCIYNAQRSSGIAFHPASCHKSMIPKPYRRCSATSRSTIA